MIGCSGLGRRAVYAQVLHYCLHRYTTTEYRIIVIFYWPGPRSIPLARASLLYILYTYSVYCQNNVQLGHLRTLGCTLPWPVPPHYHQTQCQAVNKPPHSSRVGLCSAASVGHDGSWSAVMQMSVVCTDLIATMSMDWIAEMAVKDVTRIRHNRPILSSLPLSTVEYPGYSYHYLVNG